MRATWSGAALLADSGNRSATSGVSRDSATGPTAGRPSGARGPRNEELLPGRLGCAWRRRAPEVASGRPVRADRDQRATPPIDFMELVVYSDTEAIDPRRPFDGAQRTS